MKGIKGVWCEEKNRLGVGYERTKQGRTGTKGIKGVGYERNKGGRV